MPIGPALNALRLQLTWPEVDNVFDGKTSETQMTSRFAYGVAALLLLLAAIGLSFYFMRPPAAVSALSPPDVFSAERALQHLKVIAQNPHPIGSAEHGRVRDYIVAQLQAQGFETEVSTATALGPPQNKPFRAATVQNITGRLRGAGNGKSVMLVAHYDSVPTGPGASDDGAAVAALLETARALKAGPQVANDIVILLTDGEEIGLMGSSAFVQERGSANDVGAVFNFEARGTSGQSVMFETSEGNNWLIQEFARGSSAPVGNSLMYEIYKRLPNDTDFSQFKKAGYAGLNFAYINELPRYHTATDNIQNLDAGSLQHHGANALALARHFGDFNFDRAVKGSAVYFNPLGSLFVHYSYSLVIPFAVFVLLVYVAVVVLGLKKKSLRWRGLALGSLMMLLAGVSSYAAVTLVLWLARLLIKGEELVPWGDPYNSSYFIWSLVSVSCAAVFACYILFRRWMRMHELALGALFWWTMLAVAFSVAIPGGSYLFVWPLLFALLGLGVSFWLDDRRALIVSAVCAIPGIFLFVPLLYTLFAALTFNSAAMILLSLVLLLGLLVPAVEAAAAALRWRLPAAALWFALALFSAGLLTFGFDANHPKMSSIFYGMNADSGKAVWASFDAQPDEWTTQFFSKGAQFRPLTELIPTAAAPFLQSDAPPAQLPPPGLALLEDRAQGDARLLRLRVTSPRGAEIVSLYPDAEVTGASVNGKQVNLSSGAWSLQYYALPPQGAEVALEVKASGPVKIRVTDRSYGLPQLPGVIVKPRPDYMILPPGSASDMTMVGKAFEF